jgi:hypothetical protein
MHKHAPTWLVLSSLAMEDIRQSALIPAVIFTTFALGTVLLRWYSRMCLSPGVCRAEDYCVSGALVGFRVVSLERIANNKKAIVYIYDGCCCCR